MADAAGPRADRRVRAAAVQQSPWDPQRWAAQSSPGFTLLSFLNCTKYPPSLCYLLMTLGPGLVLRAWFERGTPALLKPFLVFGRVTLFHYLIHLPLIHGLSQLWFVLREGRADFYFDANPAPAGADFSLLAVYLIWLAVVLALYPACPWFAGHKRRRREAWLSYL